MAQQPASLVVFEACGSASYWAREMEALDHEAKLIAPPYVRPFVKRQKNDAHGAEAIGIAARQPEMRFVAPKTVNQQPRAALFRGRELCAALGESSSSPPDQAARFRANAQTIIGYSSSLLRSRHRP